MTGYVLCHIGKCDECVCQVLVGRVAADIGEERESSFI